ncbi:MAG: hypothetical protein AB7P04_12505, partial [Bacteriovoracia bacterium]
MNQRSAISKINRAGVLLVFPVNNKREPRSLWYEFSPRTPMRWEWDESGDNRVADMWHLMKRLSDCRQVVYVKWYQGRATFFSRPLFTALLAVYRRQDAGIPPGGSRYSLTARRILEALESDSPLSTKELKRMTDLQGKFNESAYSKGVKELFTRLSIVAFGEVDDGAFPSLAVGATRHLYEDLWEASGAFSDDEAWALIH